MAWFRYYDLDGNYVYPNLRKKITFPIAKENIVKDSWLFIDVENLDVDIYYALNKQGSIFTKTASVDPDSYLVVYEDKSSENYDSTPVITQIVDNLLYFKAAENHSKDIDINKQYSLYYKTPNLKLIKKRTQDNQYQACEESESQFVSSEEDVNVSSYIRDLNSNNYYNLSFVNSESNWDSGVSKNPGASLIGTFTGPNIKIYSDKGPDYGKFRIRIMPYGSDQNADNEIVLDYWEEIDLYNQNKSTDALVFSKTDLSYKNYVFEIVSNYEKNILSSDGKINIKKYSFSLNNYLTLNKEEVSSSLLGRIVTGATL
jgi:hypothetical protein